MTSVVPRNHRPLGYAGDLNVSPNACIIPWVHNARKRWLLRDVAPRSLIYSVEESRQITVSTPGPLDPPGRLLALDLGAKRIGAAVSDELRVTTRPLPVILR